MTDINHNEFADVIMQKNQVPTAVAAAVLLFAMTLFQPAAAQDFERVSISTEYGSSELREVVNLYAADRSALHRRWDAPYSERRRQRMRQFYEKWSSNLDAIDYGLLSLEGKIDFVLMRNELEYEVKLLDRESELAGEMREIVPFGESVIALHESLRDFDFAQPQETAVLLNKLPAQISALKDSLKNLAKDEMPSRIAALRAANWMRGLDNLLEDWFEFYSGYDPMFTWWNERPYEKLKAEMRSYQKLIESQLVGIKEGEDPPIVGDPIGDKGLAEDLKHELIPYTPAELLEIARLEFAWCENEMIKASRELGFGDDWKSAQEHVKTLYVPPGDQIELVRDLAFEAVQFLETNDLITVPEMAKEVWRMRMLSPERQKIAPFFLGGEVVQVAFPTDEMEHDDKMMSLRGNNEHYSRAVVHHELIPGHHLQGFMNSRYNSHRRVFGTPFWTEGWALHWEMFLWDEGFPRSAEDKVGMLFWRMHRAARIIFSLGFHMGEMSPQEAIDFLVERVGHERANATAEVRRSFNGTYSPLYQAGYMLGGLQIRSLHAELVQSGMMTNRDFHDTILKGGRMPIEMVRARLTGEAPTEDFSSTWRFYDQD